MSDLAITLIVVVGGAFMLGTLYVLAKLLDGDWDIRKFFLWKWYYNWRKFCKHMEDENTPRFTYEQIVTYYNTAPDKWHMYWVNNSIFGKDMCLRLRYRKTSKKKNYYTNDEYMFVGVKTLWDYLRVIQFFNKAKKRREKHADDIDKSKKMAEILGCLKADAVNAQAEAERLMNDQEKELNEILHRLMETASVGGH